MRQGHMRVGTIAERGCFGRFGFLSVKLLVDNKCYFYIVIDVARPMMRENPHAR